MKGDKSGRKGQLSVATEVNTLKKIDMNTLLFDQQYLLSNYVGLVIWCNRCLKWHHLCMW